MKRSTLFLSMALATAAAFGQATPTHPLDIDGLNFPDGTFSTWFPAWEVGAPPQNISKMDDEFYKSRTRPLERISMENDTYDANPTAPYARKFCGFYGATDPTDTWKTLPRYCLKATTTACGPTPTCSPTGLRPSSAVQPVFPTLPPRMAQP